MAQCTLCPSGKYSADLCQPSCKACTPQKWTAKLGGQESCIGLTESSYAAAELSWKNRWIAPDKFHREFHTVMVDPTPMPTPAPTPKPCPAGTTRRWMYVVEGGIKEKRSQCLKCPKGQYMDAPTPWTGSTEDTLCHVCPIGKFEPKEGAKGCQLCPVGRTTPSFMETFKERCTLKTCPPGQFMKRVFSHEDCYFCPQGKFISKPSRLLKCDSCPAGKYNAHLSRSTCRTCAAGRVTTSQGSAKCNKCKAGKTSNAPRTACAGQQKQRLARVAPGDVHEKRLPAGSSGTPTPREFCSCMPGKSPRSARTRCSTRPQAPAGGSASDDHARRRLIVRVEHARPSTRRLLPAGAAHAHQGGDALPMAHVCKVVDGHCHCCECSKDVQDSSTDEAAAWMAAFHGRNQS
jgi:hypothetical protein